MNIYLEKVTSYNKETLYRLLQYSLFEESEYDGNEMNDKALFDYKYFELYFKEKDRDAYFIKEQVSNKLLGFAMVNTYTQIFKSGHSIAEYMVIPKYRRNKIGKQAAIGLFEKYKGNWEIQPSLNSNKAYSFWQSVIKDYTNDNYEFKNGIFAFENFSRN